MRECMQCESFFNNSNRKPCILSCCDINLCFDCWSSAGICPSCKSPNPAIFNHAPIVNNVLLGILESRHSSFDSNRALNCEGDECKATAVWHCKLCQADLCDQCDKETHKRVRKHLRIPVHEKEPELPICEEHEEKMKAFCETHDVLICSICLGMDHQKPCVVKRIHEVVQRKKFIAEKKLTVLQKMKGRVEESIEDCNHLFVNLDLDEQTLIQGIRREYAKLKENVEFQKANLQGILETINELPSHFKSLNNVSDTLFPIEVIQLLKFLPKTTFYNSIYACDSQHHQVTVFDLNDFSLMDSFGGYGHEDGNLCSPCSVTVDFNGFVYISEQSNHRIHVFQSTENGHEFIRKWGLYGNQDGQLMSPGGITTDLDGHVYVCDRGNYRIQVFRSDGTFLRKWGSSGNSDGQFESPSHIAVDKKGFVYVCDSSLERVQVFHVNGRFVSKWGNRGSGDGEFSGIFGIAIGEDGLVYISEISNHRIQVFQFDGTFVRKWGSRGSGNSQFNQPKDLLIDHFGFVHVFDSRNNRVSHFTSTGEFLGNLESSDSRISCFSGAALALL